MGVRNKEDNIIDIDLSPIQKTKIRVNGDQTKIIELNLSDLHIVGRLKEAYGTLEKLSQEVPTLMDDIPDDDVEAMGVVSDRLSEIDKKMREQIDFIFDSPVSDVCVPNGTMYDLHNGEFTYEHIINSLGKLFTDNVTEEYKRLKVRVEKHTGKYTKGTKKK